MSHRRPPGGSKGVLQFIGSVNIAVRLVQEAAGETTSLVVVEGVTKDGSSTSNTNDVSKLVATFRTDEGHATIATLPDTFREWGKPELHTTPFLGNASIEWPEQIKLDVTKAYEILEEAGHAAPFTGITLVYPLAPGVEEPHYVFDGGNGYYVGTVTGKVYPPQLEE